MPGVWAPRQMLMFHLPQGNERAQPSGRIDAAAKQMSLTAQQNIAGLQIHLDTGFLLSQQHDHLSRGEIHHMTRGILAKTLQRRCRRFQMVRHFAQNGQSDILHFQRGDSFHSSRFGQYHIAMAALQHMIGVEGAQGNAEPILEIP